jgi:hypothetical protein
MPTVQEEMKSLLEDGTFDTLGNSAPGSPEHTKAMAEIQRRSMEIDRNSVRAQEKAADAAFDSAKSARMSARYSLGALLVAVVSLIVSVVSFFR